MSEEFNYFQHEMRKVVATAETEILMRVWGDCGGTRTLSLTPEQFDRLEALMIDMGKE
jgi:hypothetical protein